MARNDTTPRPFRGMKDADDLKGRCIVDDFTDCWHWQGAMRTDGNGKRSPAAYVWDSVRQQFRTMTGPLMVLELVGRRVLGVKMAWRTCQCDDCVNPAHVAGGTRKDWGRWLAGHGVWKNNPRRIAANRKAARERGGTDPAVIAKVRESPLNGLQAAAEFGLTPQHVSQIRNHKVWNDQVAPGASVFTLGARNA